MRDLKASYTNPSYSNYLSYYPFKEGREHSPYEEPELTRLTSYEEELPEVVPPDALTRLTGPS